MIYARLNDFTRYVIDDMHDGEFRALSLKDAWDYYNWLAQDTYEWDMGTNPRQVQLNHGIPPLSSPSCNTMHSIYNGSYLSNDCMNYKEVSLDCNTNFHLPCQDSPQLNSSYDVMHSHEHDLNPSPDCKHYNHDVDSCDDSSSFIDSRSLFFIQS